MPPCPARRRKAGERTVSAETLEQFGPRPSTAADCQPDPASAWVYMVRCADGSLYSGWTNDLARRLRAHKGGKAGAKYTHAKGAVKLTYAERCTDKSAALKREAALKKLPKPEKEALAAQWTAENTITLRDAAPEDAAAILAAGEIPVLADPEAKCRTALRPDVVVDAILAKKNLGTRITDAPCVIGVGPGFTAGEDCHAAVETMRGHTLGRALYHGSPLPNTNIPGLIGGFAGERVLRAPADGIFVQKLEIGASVHTGDVAGTVNGVPMLCQIDGMLRGILPDGTPVTRGMKSGDVDPRGKREYCDLVSDKALAIGGGVLEAILSLTGALRA